MYKILYVTIHASFIFSICEDLYIEIDNQCYYQTDIQFIEQLILNSQNNENSPSAGLSPT